MWPIFNGGIMEEYIKGIFGGALVICLLMMNFPERKQCVVEFGKGNVTHVLVGKYDE